MRGVALARKTNIEPPLNRRIPITIKSERVQTTSLLNCIAIRGIDNITHVIRAIYTKTEFCIMMSLFFDFMKFSIPNNPSYFPT